MRSHEAQSEAVLSMASVDIAHDPSTCAPAPRAKALARMAPHRGVAAAVASRIVAKAASASSYRAIGASLDVHHSAVDQWANAGHGAAFTIRDLIASHERGERAFAGAVIDGLRALFAESDEEPAPPSRVGNAISHAAGNICGLAFRIEADNHVSIDEEAEFLAALRAAEAVIVNARRAREAKR